MLFDMNLRRSRWLILGLIVVIAILAGGELRRSLGIELDVESVREFAASLGTFGPLLFVGVVALRSLLALPSQVVLIAAGLCFGTILGTIIGGTGLMLSGTGIFLGTRFAGRKEIATRKESRLGRFLEASGHRAGALAIALGSGYPVSPLSPIHAAAGLTPMSVGLFMLAALCGGMLRASIFSYFGNALTESSRSAFVYGTIGLLVILALPLCFAQGRAWVGMFFGRGSNEEAAPKAPRSAS